MHYPSSDSKRFITNVFHLTLATAIAQALPVLAVPLLTRLYQPEHFGSFSLYAAILSVLVTVSLGRYELALIVPSFTNMAVNLIAVACLSLLATCLLTLLAVLFLNGIIIYFLHNEEISSWLYFLPFALFLMGFFQVTKYWLNRLNLYRGLGILQIARALITVLTTLILGYFGFGLAGMIIGFMVGYLMPSLVLCVMAWWNYRVRDSRKQSVIRWKRVLVAAIRYRKFPIFNVPYSLLNIIGQRVVLFILVAYSSLETIGYFAVAKTLVFIPIGVIGMSLGQVFYKHASVFIDDANFGDFVYGLMRRVAEVSIPFLAFFYIWGPSLLEKLLGEEWTDVGWFAVALLPAAFGLFYTAWLDRIFDIRGRQGTALFLQLISDFIILSLLWGILAQGFQPLTGVVIYACALLIYNIVWACITLHIAGIPLTGLLIVFQRISLVGGSVGLAVVAIKSSGIGELAQILMMFTMLSIYYITWYKRNLRRGWYVNEQMG